MASTGLNPLHCGAVVASDRPPPHGGGAGRSLNPLHCGAVVACLQDVGPRGRPAAVSIPFIAGQWSLWNSLQRRPPPPPRLNPLHCGAVVASRIIDDQPAAPRTFQSPSLRGSGRFSVRPSPFEEPGECVSIPFIAGQWSLRAAFRARRRVRRAFQSPSLRGSGRFVRARRLEHQLEALFQSPSLRGSGRFLLLAHLRLFVQSCFNPLHCGAVVASFRS